jgi:hypothetical protein
MVISCLGNCGVPAAAAAALFCVTFPATAGWVQKKVVPVQVSTCGSEKAYLPEKLFDGKKGVEDKWCCFHAGYNTAQTHWVNVDLGQSYPLAQCVIYHEGYRAADQSHYNTEDFTVSGSEASLQGPWTPIAAISDNVQPFNVIPGNNVRARYLRLEITDPESLNNPRSPNHDFATRILEWEISVWENRPDGSGPVSSANPPNASVPGGNGGAPGSSTSRQVLYYFFLTEHQKSREFYNSVILKRENWPVVTRYTVIPVEMNADRAKVQELGVYKSPTSVITTAEGRKVADLPGVADEQEFLKFLQNHLK